MKGRGFGGADVFADKVKVTEEKGLGGVRRKSLMVKPRILILVLEGEPRARDVGGERGVFKIGDGRDSGVDGEGSYKWGR